MTISEALNKLTKGFHDVWLRIKEFFKDFYQLYKNCECELVREQEHKQSVRFAPVKQLLMKSQVNLRKPKLIQARSRL